MSNIKDGELDRLDIKSSIDKVNKCDFIISINRCESNGNSKIKISRNKFINYE